MAARGRALTIILLLLVSTVAGCAQGRSVWRDKPRLTGPTVGFLTGDAGADARNDLCVLLEAWVNGFTGEKALCQVRDTGVVVGGGPGSEEKLDEFADAVAERTELELRPVEQSKPGAGACAPSSEVFCDIEGGNAYRVGPPRLTGANVDRVTVTARDGAWFVVISLDSAGKAAIRQLSAELAPDSGAAAIVVAGAVVSAPQFVSPIEGDMEISGGTRGTTELIAAAFRLGQDPVTLTPGDPD